MFDIKQRNKLKWMVFFVTTLLLLSGAPLRFSGSATVANRSGESATQSGHRSKFTTQSSSSYDLLLQDDSSGSILRWNSTNGEYLYSRCSDGFILTGTGRAISHGSTYTLTDNSEDRRVSATLDGAARAGEASVQYPLNSTSQTITDRDTSDDPGEKDTVAPEVGVTAPNGGEIVDTLSIFGITWESSDDAEVTSQDVSYSTDGGSTYSTIVTGLAGSVNQYAWSVPLMVNKSTVRVRVVARDGACNASRDESDADFTVWNPPASFTHLAEAPLFMSGQGLTSTVYMTNTSANARVVELDPHQPVGNATQNLPYQVLLNPGASASVDVASLYTIGTDPENSHFPDLIEGGIRLRHNGTRDNDVRALLVAERDCTEEFTTPFTYATSSLSATGTMQCSPMYYVDGSTDVLVSFQNVTNVAQTVQLACHYGTGAYGTPNGVFQNQPIVLGPQKTHIVNLRSVWSAFGGAEWGSMTVFTSSPQSVVCHSVMRSGSGMSWDCPFVDPNMSVNATKVAQTVMLDYNSSQNAYLMICNMLTNKKRLVTATFHTNNGVTIPPMQTLLSPGGQQMITLNARQHLAPGGSTVADVRLTYSGLPSDVVIAGCSMRAGEDRAVAMKFKEASVGDGRRLSSPYFRFDEDISGQVLISNLGSSGIKIGARMVFANSSARPLKTAAITIPAGGFGTIDLSSVGDALAEGVIATGRVDLIHNGSDGTVTAAVIETGCYNSSQVVPLDGGVPLDPLALFPLAAAVVIPGGCAEADAITDGTVTNPTFTNPGGCYGTFIGTVQTATNTFHVTLCVPTNCVGEQSLVYTPPGGQAEENVFTVVQTSAADFNTSLGNRINPNGTTQFTLTANSPFPNSLLQVEFTGKGGSVTTQANGNGTSASITGTGPVNHKFLGNVKKIFVRQLNPDGSVNESVPLVLKAKNTGAYFALDKPLSVTDVTPNNVPVTGGTVTITGSGFQTWTLGEGSNSVTVYPAVLIGKIARHDQIPFSVITVTVPNAIKGNVGPTPREIGTCAEIGQTPCKTITVINPGGSDGIDDLTPGAPLLTINAPPPPVIDRIVSLTVAGAEGPAASNSIGMQNIRKVGAYTTGSAVSARISGRNFDRVKSVTFVGAAPTSIGPSNITHSGTRMDVMVPAFCLIGASSSVAVAVDDGVNPVVSFANGWLYSPTDPVQLFLPNIPLGAIAFMAGPCEDVNVTIGLLQPGNYAPLDCNNLQTASCVAIGFNGPTQHGIESTVFPNANIVVVRWTESCTCGTGTFHYSLKFTATNVRSNVQVSPCLDFSRSCH